MIVLGLMSGTSADGIDSALVEFHGHPSKPRWKLLNVYSLKYESSLRDLIIKVGQGMKVDSASWASLSEAITEVHAQAAFGCDPDRQAQIVGCHGQTVYHRPPEKNKRGASLQLISAELLANLLRSPVIHDFRSADMALQGHGAPLVPLTDQALLGRIGGWRALLNLGGISNITLIPPKFGPDFICPVMGWDCGPANSLIDLAMEKITDGAFSFDRDGLMASSGTPDALVINQWLQESFFQTSPPKSSGREKFGLNDLQKRLRDLMNQSNENIMATLTTFTAAIIEQEFNILYQKSLVFPIELILAGGGCRNQYMIKQIANRCKGLIVRSIEDFGIPIQAREALSFALLAWWHIKEFPGNSTYVTGAAKSIVLGMKARAK